MTAFLYARGLTKSFGGRPVLNVRELSLARGEIAVLHGDNGAGKSTLLRIIAGLLAPDACAFFSLDGAARVGAPAAAYLHQTPYMFSSSLRANVEYGARRCGLPLVNAQSAMEWAGIAHLADMPARHLSGGERCRAALARIRALRPRLYLLDEPAAHLDADGEARVRSLLADLRAEGATCIISSHDKTAAATTTWRLRDGDIIAAG